MSLAARFLRRAPVRAASLSVVSNSSNTSRADPKQREQDNEEKRDNDKDAEAEAGSSEQGGRPQGVEETNGPRGKEPTRYGDWERNGRCIDF